MREPGSPSHWPPAAIAAGAADEGAPGMRTDNFYGAYFRDPDGNKICVFKMG